MAEITASLVKELRERTGAGMMECKKALTENNGDIDAAAEWLRKSGLAKADKKASRVAAEGRIAMAQDGGKAVLVEVNSETDFVEMDADGNPVVKEDRKGAPRRAPRNDRGDDKRGPRGPRRSRCAAAASRRSDSNFSRHPGAGRDPVSRPTGLVSGLRRQ